jgi:hypothetical protein
MESDSRRVNTVGFRSVEGDNDGIEVASLGECSMCDIGRVMGPDNLRDWPSGGVGKDLVGINIDGLVWMVGEDGPAPADQGGV